MANQSRLSSRGIVLIVVGIGLVLLLCCCIFAVIASSSALFLTQQRTSTQSNYYPTVTPTPVSLGTWQYLPDLPRKINTIVVDPTNPKIVYAGTGVYAVGGSGLYKSEDGGVSWKLSVNGLPDEIVVALAISQDASVLYANIGPDGEIYASTDGAQSWHSVGMNEALCCNVGRQMIVLPNNPNKIFIVQPAADLNLSYSEDGGQTWQKVPDERNELKPSFLALDPQDPQRMFLGTSEHGVYLSTDGGHNWTPANRGMVDYNIRALVVSPADSNILYAGSYDGKLFKTTDGGQTWANISDKLPVKDYYQGEIIQIVLDPESPEVIYVLMAMGGLMRSRDGGDTWVRLAPPVARDFIPQESTMALTFKPQLQLILGINYSDGEDSGGWRCTP